MNEALDQFVKDNLDEDRVLYDCVEVEELIRKAWNAAICDLQAGGGTVTYHSDKMKGVGSTPTQPT